MQMSADGSMSSAGISWRMVIHWASTIQLCIWALRGCVYVYIYVYVYIHLCVCICMYISQSHRRAEVGRTISLEIVGSKPLLGAGSATATGHSQPSPVRFWMSPKIVSPQPLWATNYGGKAALTLTQATQPLQSSAPTWMARAMPLPLCCPPAKEATSFVV